MPEKFKTPEDLSKAYGELLAKLQTKNTDLKDSLLSEVKSELEAQSMEGVPDAPDKYEVPEGFDAEAATETELWSTFTGWAHERKLPQEDFNELVQFYAKALTPDLSAEKEKLGDNADQRTAALSAWVEANVPDDVKPTILGMANTAANFTALEAMMKLTVPRSMAKEEAATPTPAKTEADIRALMLTPEYRDPTMRKPEVVKEVEDWYAANYPGTG